MPAKKTLMDLSLGGSFSNMDTIGCTDTKNMFIETFKYNAKNNKNPSLAFFLSIYSIHIPN